MELTSYFTTAIACLALLVTISIKLADLSKKKSSASVLGVFLKAIFFIVLLIIIAASILFWRNINRTKEESEALAETFIQSDTSEEKSTCNTTIPTDAKPSSTITDTQLLPAETVEMQVPATSDSENTESEDFGIYEQALLAYQHWEQGVASDEDMQKIIEYLDGIVITDASIGYERIHYTVEDTNSFFYVNSDSGYAFDNLRELSDQIIAKIQSNQIDNHCGNYCITYCQQEDIFVIQLSMEYVN